VDHIEFESPDIIDTFISFWRQSGQQRFGYLYGEYKPYTEVPLGIKAVVKAVWEPPQVNGVDSLEVLALNGDPDALKEDARVDALAARLGLRKVHCVFINA
jgi:nuclear protein localization family protein 4